MFGDMMGKLQGMKQKMDEIKAHLENVIVEGEAAGGDIKIKVNGNKIVKSVYISDSLRFGDKEELEEQMTVAMNRAMQMADAENEKAVKEAASGILPGGLF